MNPINHFEQNRPIHLALRDVYFEKAVELVAASEQLAGAELLVKDFEEMLFMLRTARKHARFAIRHTGKNGHDEQFSLFINLLAGNVKAVLSMINLKGMVESSHGSSFSFLGVNQASAGLQAEEYQRRAMDIVRSIQNTVRLAREPFEKLKQENRSCFDDEESARYKKAREHYESLLMQKQRPPRVPALMRRFLRF
ncbi:MAG: hypothetical protein JXR25_00625 [Pontiellaceae bacterium]|nr:hypothetical protein [Pontiellaceae bacterium]MBN2783302.1 hypothetical protein [Pontiellaceae bacterium]